MEPAASTFVFIILLTAFYTAFNKQPARAALPADGGVGWSGKAGGGGWGARRLLAGESSLVRKEEWHLGSLSAGSKEKVKVMFQTKPTPSSQDQRADVAGLISPWTPEGEYLVRSITLCPLVIGDFQRLSICLISLFYILVESL